MSRVENRNEMKLLFIYSFAALTLTLVLQCARERSRCRAYRRRWKCMILYARLLSEKRLSIKCVLPRLSISLASFSASSLRFARSCNRFTFIRSYYIIIVYILSVFVSFDIERNKEVHIQ
jgi:hypothetical protein